MDHGARGSAPQLRHRRADLQPDRRRDRRHPQRRHRQDPPAGPVAHAAAGTAVRAGAADAQRAVATATAANADRAGCCARFADTTTVAPFETTAAMMDLSPVDSARRCSLLDSPAAIAAGRSAIRASPTSASAATTRSQEFPIARAMRVLPTGCPPGGARSGSRSGGHANRSHPLSPGPLRLRPTRQQPRQMLRSGSWMRRSRSASSV